MAAVMEYRPYISVVLMLALLILVTMAVWSQTSKNHDEIVVDKTFPGLVLRKRHAASSNVNGNDVVNMKGDSKDYERHRVHLGKGGINPRRFTSRRKLIVKRSLVTGPCPCNQFPPYASEPAVADARCVTCPRPCPCLTATPAPNIQIIAIPERPPTSQVTTPTQAPPQLQAQAPPQSQVQVPAQIQAAAPPRYQGQAPQYQAQAPTQYQGQAPPQFLGQAPPQYQAQPSSVLQAPTQYQGQAAPQYQGQAPPQYQAQASSVLQAPPQYQSQVTVPQSSPQNSLGSASVRPQTQVLNLASTNQASQSVNQAAGTANEAANVANQAANTANQAANSANQAANSANRAANSVNQATNPGNLAANSGNQAGSLVNQFYNPFDPANKAANQVTNAQPNRGQTNLVSSQTTAGQTQGTNDNSDNLIGNLPSSLTGGNLGKLADELRGQKRLHQYNKEAEENSDENEGKANFPLHHEFSDGRNKHRSEKKRGSPSEKVSEKNSSKLSVAKLLLLLPTVDENDAGRDRKKHRLVVKAENKKEKTRKISETPKAVSVEKGRENAPRKNGPGHRGERNKSLSTLRVKIDIKDLRGHTRENVDKKSVEDVGRNNTRNKNKSKKTMSGLGKLSKNIVS